MREFGGERTHLRAIARMKTDPVFLLAGTPISTGHFSDPAPADPGLARWDGWTIRT